MRFASIIHDDVPRAVMLDGDRAVPLAGIGELGLGTPASLLRDPPLEQAQALPLEAVSLRPVVPRPGKVICVGLNYLSHIEETQNRQHDYPVLFTKFAASLIGPYDPILRPPESAAADYEGELAIVVGKRCRRVARPDGLAQVAGFTVANDVTMRDYQYKTNQWLQGKSWDAVTPLGPWLVTPDEVGDAQTLTIRTHVNGELVQDASTAQMIFDVPTLIATISEFTTLEPGDVILTGTPAGVGFRREPPLLLNDGDVVTVEIERIGRIENRVEDERAGATR